MRGVQSPFGVEKGDAGAAQIALLAAVLVVRVHDDSDLIAGADAKGKHLHSGVEELNHPLVDYVRGRGLLRGIVLTAPRSKAVETAARAAGFLVNAAAPDVVRLAPPLIITEAQIDSFVTALPGILNTAGETA